MRYDTYAAKLDDQFRSFDYTTALGILFCGTDVRLLFRTEYLPIDS